MLATDRIRLCTEFSMLCRHRVGALMGSQAGLIPAVQNLQAGA